MYHNPLPPAGRNSPAVTATLWQKQPTGRDLCFTSKITTHKVFVSCDFHSARNKHNCISFHDSPVGNINWKNRNKTHTKMPPQVWAEERNRRPQVNHVNRLARTNRQRVKRSTGKTILLKNRRAWHYVFKESYCPTAEPQMAGKDHWARRKRRHQSTRNDSRKIKCFIYIYETTPVYKKWFAENQMLYIYI